MSDKENTPKKPISIGKPTQRGVIKEDNGASEREVKIPKQERE